MTTLAAPAALEVRRSQRFARVRELIHFRQLIALLVVRELKVRYKRSLFGLLWTMLNPLLLMIVYTVVFTTIMPNSQRNFSIFLLSALLPWLFFSTALLQGLSSILSNQDLIRKVRVPQAVFPLSVVGSNLVNFALLPVYTAREPDLSFTCTIHPPIAWKESGDKERDVQIITQRLVDTLQSAVRERPDQWYMFRPMWPGPAQTLSAGQAESAGELAT